MKPARKYVETTTFLTNFLSLFQSVLVDVQTTPGPCWKEVIEFTTLIQGV